MLEVFFWNVCLYLCCVAQWVCIWSTHSPKKEEPCILRLLELENGKQNHFNGWIKRKTVLKRVKFAMSYKCFDDLLAVVFQFPPWQWNCFYSISHSFVGRVNVCLLYSAVVLLFPSGNAQTLKHEPKEKQINTYQRLRDFWRRYYSAHYMTLAVQSKGIHKTQQEYHSLSGSFKISVLLLYKITLI